MPFSVQSANLGSFENQETIDEVMGAVEGFDLVYLAYILDFSSASPH